MQGVSSNTTKLRIITPTDVSPTHFAASGIRQYALPARCGIRHTFTIEELGVDLEVPAHKAGRIDIDAAPGIYQFVCSVPGHEAMTGTLIIEG